MPRNSYIIATDGEITLISKDGEILKLGEVTDFTVESNVGCIEHRSHGFAVDLVVPVSETFNIKIACGKLDITQSSEIKKKSLRRKIR